MVQAMRKFARLRVPVYITETGIADKSDNLRGEWAESYFKAVGPFASPIPGAHVNSGRLRVLLLAFR